MRITEGMRYASALRSLTSLSARQAEAQERATTGSRIDRPSSDPIGAAQMARLKAQLAQADSHRDTVRNVQGDAELAESSLAEAGDLLQRAREIAVQGSNGVLTAEERSTLYTEVAGLKDRMVALANTRGTNGYIFSGSKTTTAAMDAAGNFQGDDNTQIVDIGGATPTNVGTSGARAFTAAGGRNVLQDLTDLATALNANDAAGIRGTLDGLDASHTQVVNVRAEAGLTIARLDSTDSALQTLQTGLGTRAHAIGDADPFQTYSTLTQLNSSLEQAVAVTRQVLNNAGLSRF